MLIKNEKHGLNNSTMNYRQMQNAVYEQDEQELFTSIRPNQTNRIKL